MKGIVRALFCLMLVPLSVFAEGKAFRFAWLSDTHIGDPTGAEDLRRTVRDVNSLTGLSFVVISGDITQFGSHEQFVEAKSLLDGLRIPCHVEPGNHDCKWSESGATEFAKIWGDDRFVFNAGGFCFIGMHEGPVMKMGDGHFAPQDVRWLDKTLAQLPKDQPIIFVTHYPLDNQLDNWFVVLDQLKKFNTQAILIGHGHRNMKLNFEGVPAAMGRSNLRAREKIGGYTLVNVHDGIMTISERTPGVETKPPWDTIKLEKHDYAALTNQWPRPDFSVNTNYPQVKERWHIDDGWTIASTPAISGNFAIVGDASGKMKAFALGDGSEKWEFKTGGPIYSTPAVEGNRVVFASTDGNIYALNTPQGKKLWRFKTGRPDVASPVISNNIVYIGASDGKFRALDLLSGKLIWEYTNVGGFVETRPLLYDNKVIFGAWDQHLYVLDAKSGQLLWKWKAKSPGDLGVMYSPAACWPVAAKGKIFVAAPDRFMTALDLNSGAEIWRSAIWQVRESIGLAEDQSRFYVRTMPGIIAAFSTAASQHEQLWALDAHFGYDINSAMLVEKDGELFYGTKNGLLLAMDGKIGSLLWEHKLGETVLNTVVPLDKYEVLTTDVDGRITLVDFGN